MPSRFLQFLKIFPDYFETARLCLSRERGRALEVVHAVICRDGKVLLSVRSHLRGWELPGGGVRAGESVETALLREIKEETGLLVTIDQRVGCYRRTGIAPHMAWVYRCRAHSDLVIPSKETPRLAWFRFDELPKTLFPWFRVELSDALAEYDCEVDRIEHQGLRGVLAGVWIDWAMRATGDRAGGATPVGESFPKED